MKVGVVFPSYLYDRESWLKIVNRFFDSLHHMKSLDDLEFLCNWQNIPTDDAEIMDTIERFSEVSKINDTWSYKYLINHVYKPQISMCRIRNDAMMLDPECDLYLYLDDDLFFREESRASYKFVLDEFRRDSKLGLVMCAGFLGGYNYTDRLRYDPHKFYMTNLGLFFRNIHRSAVSPVYPESLFEYHQRGFEESILDCEIQKAGYRCATKFNVSIGSSWREQYKIERGDEISEGDTSIHNADLSFNSLERYLKEEHNLEVHLKNAKDICKAKSKLFKWSDYEDDGIKDRKFIIFGNEHYTQLGMIKTLGRRGIKPDFIALPHSSGLPVSSCSKYVGKVHKVIDIEEGYAILMNEYSGIESKPILLLGGGDAALSYIDANYDEVSEHFITFNAGRKNGINDYLNKDNQNALAEKCGLKIPETIIISEGDTLPDIDFYPVITKAVNPTKGGWKSDVHICNNDVELYEALKTIKSPQVMIQRYIKKINELSYSGFTVNKGKETMFCMMNNELYTIDAYYNPYHTVENPDKPDIENAVSKMLEEIGFEGIWSVEFLEDEDHNYYFLEINLRASAWDWACDVAGNPLATMWSQAMIDGNLSNVRYSKVKDNFRGLVEPIDYGKRVLTGKITIWEWLRDIMTADALYYYDENDMEPFNLLISHPDKLL